MPPGGLRVQGFGRAAVASESGKDTLPTCLLRFGSSGVSSSGLCSFGLYDFGFTAGNRGLKI